MRKIKSLFLVICLILFIIFVWGRSETQGDRGYSVYHMENAVTESGKVIILGYKFQGPIGDPVVSFRISVESRTEKAEVGGTYIVAANRQ